MRTETKSEQLQKLVTLSQINLYRTDKEGKITEKFQLYKDEKRLSDEENREIHALVHGEHFRAPVVWESKNGELIGIIEEEDNSYYLTSMLEAEELTRLLIFLEMVDNALFGRKKWQKEIMARHHIKYDETEMKVQDAIDTGRTKMIHISYHEELEFISAIEQGNKKKVFEYLEKGFIQNFYRSSVDIQTHYRNVCIVVNALACRAAISGGVSSARAYEFSHTVLKLLEDMETVSQIYSLICSLTERYTQMVIDERKTEIHDHLVEQCKQYILVHCKEKITLNDIADYVGRSPSYVSKAFSRKTGKTIVQYINEEKIKTAKDFLKYSDLDVTTISDYLSFSSQAYFGKVFKDITGMSPKQYKDQNAVKDLLFERTIKY